MKVCCCCFFCYFENGFFKIKKIADDIKHAILRGMQSVTISGDFDMISVHKVAILTC